MYTLTPRSVFDWDFDVWDAGTLAGVLRMDWLGESGVLERDGRTWVLAREGWRSGAFFLAHGGSRVASAEKPSAFERRFVCELGTETAVWSAEAAFARAFVLERSGCRAGTFRPRGWFTREGTLDLPGDVAFERQLFLAWLALLQWRRAKRR